MSTKQFCKLHQLKYSTYKGYKYRKLKSGINYRNLNNCHKEKNIKSNNDTAKFIPLQISTNIPVSDHRKIESNKTPEIQIVFKNNHKIILPLAIPEASLLLIVKAVAGL